MMKRAFLAAVATCLVGSVAPLPAADKPPIVTATQRVKAETTEQKDARMRWWREARFGVFVHWGLYAVAAGEWNGQETRGAGKWIMHDLKIPPGESRRLLSQFRAKNFDATRWVRAARAAGMQYVVVTTKHHDGFSLFDSKFSEYDVTATPFGRTSCGRSPTPAARTT